MSGETTWEGAWEVEFPATSLEELAIALMVRDLIHGTSFDFEGEPGVGNLSLDYSAGDELEGSSYRLLVTAEAAGSCDEELVRDVTERLLDQLVDEAESLVARRTDLGALPTAAVAFEVVPEDHERWDLVVPDWLAPDGAEVPFGFRPVRQASREPWPTDDQLDAHGRILVVPLASELRLIGIPAPAEEIPELAPGSLPIVS